MERYKSSKNKDLQEELGKVFVPTKYLKFIYFLGVSALTLGGISLWLIIHLKRNGDVLSEMQKRSVVPIAESVLDKRLPEKLNEIVKNGFIEELIAMNNSNNSKGGQGMQGDAIADGTITFLDWASNGCLAGEIPKYNGTVWVCATDESGDTYKADGQGIELSGTQFSLELDGTTLSKTEAGLKLADSFASSLLTTSTTFGGDVSGIYNNIIVSDDSHSHTPLTLPANTTFLDSSIEFSEWGQLCGDGQIPKYEDTTNSWTCADDADTTYTAGDGLFLNGTIFRVDSPTCSGTEKLMWNGTSFVCAVDIDTDTDTNNYTTGIAFSGTTTKTLVLTRSGLVDLIADFEDIGFADPMTNTGDIIYRSASGTTRLPAGNEGDVLTIVGSVPTWQPITGTTLQSAYDNGSTITTVSSRDIVFTLSSGNFNVTGSGSVNLTPSGDSQFTSGGVLTLTAGASSTWSTSSGVLTLQSGSGIVSLGTSTGLTANASLTISSGPASSLILDSGTTGNILIGTDANSETIGIGTGEAVKIVTIGSTNTSSSTVIQSGSGNIKLEVGGNGTSGNVYIGGTPGGTPDLLVLDTKNDNATDPIGVDGALYYNSVAGKFRCYQAGAWTDCIGTLPTGSLGQTLRYNGSEWVANSLLYNDGTFVRIGYPGADGEFRIYSEQGAIDHEVILRPNPAMTQDTIYYLPPDDGEPGQFLTTDGNGNLTWATPNMGGATSRNYVFAYDTNVQAISAANTWQTITFSERSEIDGWTYSTGEFTAPATGKYQIAYFVYMSKASGGSPQIGQVRLEKNGVEVSGTKVGVQFQSNNVIATLSINSIVSVNAGDVIRLRMKGQATAIRIVPTNIPPDTGAVSALLQIIRVD